MIKVELPKECWMEIILIVDKESTGLMMSDFENLVERGKELQKIVNTMTNQVYMNMSSDKALQFSLEKIREAFMSDKSDKDAT